MEISKQAEANRKNAQMSTGPKTKEGKAKSSMNALTHGLTARQVILPGEDPDEYEALLSQLMQEHDPQSILEASLIEIIAGAIWRLKRIPQFEPAIILAYKAFNEQADAVFMRKVNEIIMRGPLQTVQKKLEEVKEVGELSADDAAVLESFVAIGAKATEFETPTARLGRALVLQGNALEQLGKLSRYERDLTANLKNHISLLEEIKEKRITTIDICDD